MKNINKEKPCLDDLMKESVNKINNRINDFKIVDYKGVNPVILGIKPSNNSDAYFFVTTNNGKQYQVNNVGYKIDENLLEPVLTDIKIREYSMETGLSHLNNLFISRCNITGKTKHIKKLM